MFNIIAARLRQGHRTMRYPDAEPTLPARFKGLPELAPDKCAGAACGRCAAVCPTGAIVPGPGAGAVSLDMGLCLFCGACEEACKGAAVRFTRGHSLAANTRGALLVGGGAAAFPAAAALGGDLRRLFGRSLKLRQVSAGGCNACEADFNVLNTLAFDLGRFGIQPVASPRHADGLLVTGPVTRNMELALMKTYEAVPPPKIVIAVGACAISGGLFRDTGETAGGVCGLLPVDLLIPGCPPHPITILDGLLRLVGRVGGGSGR